MNKSYGMTRMLLKQMADREGVPMDVVIENVCLERELAGTMTTNLRHQSYVDHTGNVVLVD